MSLRRRAVHIVGTEGKSTSVVEWFSASLQVSEPQDESTARRRDCPSDTALGKSKSSLYIVSLTRTVPSLSCRHRESELKSPPVHQLLAPNFSLCALRVARPLLSCHPSCPHAPRCPIVAIQLFIFLFLSPLLSHSGCVVCMIAGRFKGGMGGGFKRRPLLCGL